jgi:taurine dioxygenase
VHSIREEADLGDPTKLSIRPLNPTIGAEVAGVDLAAPLEASTVAALRQALLDHLVLFFRDQPMTPEEQFRFSEYFAPVMIPTIDTISTEQPGVTVIDQIAPKGEYTDRWHTDHTFVEQTPLGAVLRAVQLPSSGGDTCFASMYAAYETLSPDMKRFLEPLTAVHSTEIVSRGIAHLGNVETRQEMQTIHPVVRVHPETGRKLLFVCGNFTTRISQLSDAESDALLAFLFEHIKNPAFQCRFQWEVDSVAFWDNRCTQHCAIPDYTERRMMHRTMMRGDRPFGSGEQAA